MSLIWIWGLLWATPNLQVLWRLLSVRSSADAADLHHSSLRSKLSLCWCLVAHVHHLPPFNSPPKRSAKLLDLSFSRSTWEKLRSAHVRSTRAGIFCAPLISDSAFTPSTIPQGLLRGHSGVDYLPWTDTADSHCCLTRCLYRSSPESSLTEQKKPPKNCHTNDQLLNSQRTDPKMCFLSRLKYRDNQ